MPPLKDALENDQGPAIDRSHISYGVALAAFVATSFCVALHMVKLRLHFESIGTWVQIWTWHFRGESCIGLDP